MSTAQDLESRSIITMNASWMSGSREVNDYVSILFEFLSNLELDYWTGALCLLHE